VAICNPLLCPIHACLQDKKMETNIFCAEVLDPPQTLVRPPTIRFNALVHLAAPVSIHCACTQYPLRRGTLPFPVTAVTVTSR